jgi:hypothetical protein
VFKVSLRVKYKSNLKENINNNKKDNKMVDIKREILSAVMVSILMVGCGGDSCCLKNGKDTVVVVPVEAPVPSTSITVPTPSLAREVSTPIEAICLCDGEIYDIGYLNISVDADGVATSEVIYNDVGQWYTSSYTENPKRYRVKDSDLDSFVTIEELVESVLQSN